MTESGVITIAVLVVFVLVFVAEKITNYRTRKLEIESLRCRHETKPDELVPPTQPSPK